MNCYVCSFEANVAHYVIANSLQEALDVAKETVKKQMLDSKLWDLKNSSDLQALERKATPRSVSLLAENVILSPRTL